MKVKCTKQGKRYYLDEQISYYSGRYGKWVVLPVGYSSDGATGALDIDSLSWWVHDFLCDYGTFSDGSLCTNWQASTILHDILLIESRWFRARSWWIATWLCGGGKARENGMW